MKKEFSIHLIYTMAYLISVAVIRGWLSWNSWPLLVGGLVGMVLPYADHFIYIYLFAPQELSSQRVMSLVSQKKYYAALDLTLYTAHERAKLIFHTAYFQIIFWALTILLVTSSGSIFGVGLVLAFCLHLVIDQMQELFAIGNLDSWFRELQQAGMVGITRKNTKMYFGANVLALIFAGFIL